MRSFNLEYIYNYGLILTKSDDFLFVYQKSFKTCFSVHNGPLNFCIGREFTIVRTWVLKVKSDMQIIFNFLLIKS